MYGLTAQILKERGQYQDLVQLGEGSMEIFRPTWDGKDVHLDTAYQATLPEFQARKAKLGPADVPGAFAKLFEG